MQTTFTAVGRRLIAPLTVISPSAHWPRPQALGPTRCPRPRRRSGSRTSGPVSKDAADHRTPSDLAAQTSEAADGPGFDLGDAAIGAGAGVLAALSLGVGVTRRRRLTATG